MPRAGLHRPSQLRAGEDGFERPARGVAIADGVDLGRQRERSCRSRELVVAPPQIGRIQVASRAVGVGRAALEDALRYAQQRESFGKPLWQHQSVGNYLADMVNKLTAARQLVLHAARKFDSGERADMEAGMAKLFASEAAMQIALDAMRIHGGYGYSTEYDAERYFRDAPLMIVGEGTNEIQRNVIAAQLVSRGGI